MLYFIKKWWKNFNKKFEIVEFHDGTFGIRNISKNIYQDFRNTCFWWSSSSEWFNHCKTTRFDAEQRYESLIFRHNPVKRVVK